jgi:hypothetical protein
MSGRGSLASSINSGSVFNRRRATVTKERRGSMNSSILEINECFGNCKGAFGEHGKCLNLQNALNETVCSTKSGGGSFGGILGA